jgi:hypothetical protein
MRVRQEEPWQHEGGDAERQPHEVHQPEPLIRFQHAAQPVHQQRQRKPETQQLHGEQRFVAQVGRHPQRVERDPRRERQKHDGGGHADGHEQRARGRDLRAHQLHPGFGERRRDALRDGATDPEIEEAQITDHRPREAQQAEARVAEAVDDARDEHESDERGHELPEQAPDRVVQHHAWPDATAVCCHELSAGWRTRATPPGRAPGMVDRALVRR